MNLISKKRIFAPMGSTANKHGRVIADNICGDMIKYPGVLGTGICQILNWQAGSTGLNEKTAKAAGIEFESVVVPGFDRLGYMPGAQRLVLKLLAEIKTPIDNIATAANVLMNKIEGRLRSINPKDFKELRKSGEYTLVDVRTPGEYKSNRIAGCANIINLPLGKVRSEAENVLADKDAKLVCSCQINLRGYDYAAGLRL